MSQSYRDMGGNEIGLLRQLLPFFLFIAIYQ